MEVSVIVCNYNQEKYLEKCLGSLNNQVFDKEYEIIFIDDCSTDGSKEIFEKYIDNPKFKILPQSVNRGQSSSRNIGLEVVKGKYICFLDSDDFASSTFISSLYNAIQRDSDIDCVVANFYGVDEEDIVTGKVSKINRYIREKVVPTREGNLAREATFDGILSDDQCRAYLIKELSTVLAKTVIPEQKLGDIKVESKAKAPKALSVRAI